MDWTEPEEEARWSPNVAGAEEEARRSPIFMYSRPEPVEPEMNLENPQDVESILSKSNDLLKFAKGHKFIEKSNLFGNAANKIKMCAKTYGSHLQKMKRERIAGIAKAIKLNKRKSPSRIAPFSSQLGQQNQPNAQVPIVSNPLQPPVDKPLAEAIPDLAVGAESSQPGSSEDESSEGISPESSQPGSPEDESSEGISPESLRPSSPEDESSEGISPESSQPSSPEDNPSGKISSQKILGTNATVGAVVAAVEKIQKGIPPTSDELKQISEAAVGAINQSNKLDPEFQKSARLPIPTASLPARSNRVEDAVQDRNVNAVAPELVNAALNAERIFVQRSEEQDKSMAFFMFLTTNVDTLLIPGLSAKQNNKLAVYILKSVKELWAAMKSDDTITNPLSVDRIKQHQSNIINSLT